ncbi:hypothetical protein GO003_015825 [Methylicorpusculum oleiharenae]|uniref:hypothetical protein n=1 Tax=Methylicorpusculum oleiharenae TaxID=1338687 RepID=UPI00135BBA93|nr:hypothetical protein [Methylicorpusculum oleiharenae]MCD2451856.1 hypothetical protein [Methylicorpusculum oleiharenae]
MKKHVISAAIAAATLTGFSGPSMAWNTSTVPDLEVFMSGATAMDNAIKNMFENLCDAGTLDFYRNGSDPDATKVGSAYSAYFCTLSPTKVPNLSSAKKVLFIKRSAGGSAQGVNPLVDGAQLDALNIFNNNCTNVPNTKTWNCTITGNSLVKKYPNIGISDVDPLQFRGPNTPVGFNEITPAGAQQLEIRAVAALIFGIPVTNGLYEALQVVQKDQGKIPSDCQIGVYVEDEAVNERCMPTLSKHQVASIISGQIKNWDEFVFEKDGQDYPFTQYPGVTAPETNLVHICKRVAGSGTGAQQYNKFLNNPCSPGALEPTELDDPFDGPRTILNSGSGNVDLCLDDFSDGTNVGGANVDVFTGGPTVAWATGVQSLEKNANNALSYKFVRIDGVAPTLQNAANGTYMDWVEPTYQWRKSGNGAPTGDTLRIIEKLIVDAGAPSTVASVLNKTSTYRFGKSGYLAVASNGHPYSHILNEAAPVIGYSHAAGGVLNNCNVPVIPAAATQKPL